MSNTIVNAHKQQLGDHTIYEIQNTFIHAYFSVRRFRCQQSTDGSVATRCRMFNLWILVIDPLFIVQVSKLDHSSGKHMLSNIIIIIIIINLIHINSD